ncbi:MAG: hypothetical protein NZZ41_07975 [Candidatus Dojkabacteria bacterium]|nr:hypothetical protein [Candidatus Dojkabacteria bacterium]
MEERVNTELKKMIEDIPNDNVRNILINEVLPNISDKEEAEVVVEFTKKILDAAGAVSKPQATSNQTASLKEAVVNKTTSAEEDL